MATDGGCCDGSLRTAPHQRGAAADPTPERGLVFEAVGRNLGDVLKG